MSAHLAYKPIERSPRIIIPHEHSAWLLIQRECLPRLIIPRCGGANHSRTTILGCTQEPRRKAVYCLDVVVCAQENGEKEEEKVERVE